MTLQLPDCPGFSADDLRLELACALFGRGRISAIMGAKMAGLDMFAFQHALAQRGISRVSEDEFAADLAVVRSMAAS